MRTTRHERGVALITAMIMLTLVTLVIVTAFRLSDSNAKIVANAQLKDEMQVATNTALDRTISDTGFFTSAYSVPVTIKNYEASANTASAKADIVVTIVPACVKARILANKDATPISENCLWVPGEDQTYLEGQNQGTSQSLCANTLWDIKADAADPFTGKATSESHELVELTTGRTTLPAKCGL